MKELFQIHVWDEKTLIIKCNEMDSEEYASFHSRMMGFPERRFSRQLEAWLVPQTEKNVTYLVEHFSSEEYLIDEEAAVFVEYTIKTKKLSELKAQRRWKFTFEGTTPPKPKNYKFKTEPYNHQLVASDAIHGSEFFGLLMEMGTGKTKVVIDEVCRAEIPKTLIVCPKTVIGTWFREFKKHATKPYFIRRLRIQSDGVEDLIAGLQAPEKIKIWVTNYDRIRTNMEGLMRLNFNLVVCDESTYIKNPSSKRTKALLELAETAKRRFILTGTPAGNTLLDLFSQFQFLQPGILGYSNFNQYKYYYGRFAQTRCGFEKLTGYRSIKELQTRMASCSFVVKKKDCLDLPDKIYEERYVEMGKVQRELYEQMLMICLADLEGQLKPDSTVQATVVIVQLLRLSQICCGYLKCIDGGEKRIPDGDVKLEAVKDIINDTDSESKICIWTRFRHDVIQVSNLLRKMNIPYVCLTGKENEAQRERNIISFGSDCGARVLIGEPGSGGMGVTLIGSENRPCTTVIYYSNDFSMLKRAQSEDRSHRIGIKQPISYIDIVCEDSLETQICKILQSKKEINDKIQNFESIKKLLLGNGNSDGKLKVIKSKKREVPAWVYDNLKEEMAALQG